MAKGVRSKVRKRKQASKIRYMEAHVAPARYQQIHSNILQTIKGIEQKKDEKVNAFLHPNHPKAEFPQYRLPDMTDLRCSNIEFSGKEYRGAYRKRNTAVIKDQEKQAEILQIEQESDSNEEVEENDSADELINGLEKIKIGRKKQDKTEVTMGEKSKVIKKKFRPIACKRSKNQLTVFSRSKGNKKRK